MKRHQMPVNINLLLFVYSLLSLCKTYQATTIVVSSQSRVLLNSTNPSSLAPPTSDYITSDYSLAEQALANHPRQSYGLSTTDLVTKNDTADHYSDIQNRQLHFHSYNVSDSLSFNSSVSSQLADDLSTSDSSLLMRAISPKMDSDENLVDIGGSSDAEDYPYGSVESASSNLSEQKAVRELTKILSRGLAGVTDHVGVERLENWKQQQKYRKKVKDDRARLFEDILMAAIESHPDKTERYKTKRTKHRTQEDSPHNRSIPFVGNYITSVDPELAQDAETIVQNLQGIASVFGGPDSEYGTSGIRDDKSTQDESDIDKINPGGPLSKHFNKIKKQLSNRRKQFDQIKKIFNQDYTTTQSDLSSYQQNNPNKHYRDSNYRDEDEFTIADEYPRPLSRRSPSRNYRLEQLSNYLLENPAALGSALAELSSSSSSYTKHSTRELPSSISPLVHSDSKIFSRRYRESLNSEEHQGLDSVTKKPSRQDSSTNIGVRDVSLEGNANHHLNNDVLNPVTSPIVTQTGSNSVMSTAETLLLNSLKERQLMNLIRLETVLAERQQQAATSKNVVISSNISPLSSDSRNLNQPSKTTNRVSNSTHSSNSRTQESIKNQKHSNKEELHHFVVVNQNPTSTKPEDYGTDLSSLNIDPYDAAALDQERSTPKLNRFKDWTDVSQSETRSSVVKDEGGNVIYENESDANKRDETPGFIVSDKRSIARRVSNNSDKESSRRFDDRVDAVPTTENDHSLMEERDEEEVNHDRSRKMNNEDANEDNSDGAYVKLDRIALGSEMKSGPVDYFSAYKNEIRSSSSRPPSKVNSMWNVGERKKQKIEADEEEDGGAAMWAR